MQFLWLYIPRDGSAVYGDNEKKAKKIRTYVDGKLVIGDDGLLLHDENGVPLSGDVRNNWVGVSILQALFVKEHNAVCDAIKVREASLLSICLVIRKNLLFLTSCHWKNCYVPRH